MSRSDALSDTPSTRIESLITEELFRRPVRESDHAAEARALAALADTLADSPLDLPQRLAELALELCRAGSAGVSILDNGSRTPCWKAVAGRFASHPDRSFDQTSEPCGLALERAMPLLFRHPEQFFRATFSTGEPVGEFLTLPFRVGGKAVGTVWVASHSDGQTFDREDLRLLNVLAKFASAGFRHSLVAENPPPPVPIRAVTRGSNGQGHVVRNLTDPAQSHLSETLELAVAAADLGTWVWDPVTDELTLSRRAAEIFGVSPDRTHLREWMRGLVHPEDRDLARSEAARAVAAKTDYDIEYRLDRPTPVWIAARGRGVHDEAGTLVRMLGVLQDVTARKQAEAALRTSEERLRKLADNLPSGFIYQIVHGPAEDRRFAFLSAGVETVCGVTPAEVVTNPLALYGAILEEDRARVQEAEGTAFLTQSPFDCQFRINGPGGVRWLHCRSALQRQPDGGGLWDGVAIDVTAKKQMESDRERLLREVETERRQLAEVFQHAPSFMAVLRGPGHVFERVNDRYATLVQDREVVGRTVKDALPEVEGEGFLDLLDTVYRTGEPYLGTNALVRLQGPVPGALEERFLQFVYQPMRDAAGAVHGILVLGIDLTDRRRAEADLIRLTAASDRRRRLYETALNNTPDLVYVFDVRHRYTYANESLLAMWGLSWDEAIGKSLLELGYEPWHAEMHDREIDRVIATKKPIQGEVPFTGTYGRRIYEYIFAPVLGADGEVEAIAGTTRDVTDRKQAEEAIRVRELRALEILESITDAFFLIDRDWCFTYVNRQAERVLERQPGDLLGVNLWEEYPGLPGSEFERAYRKAMDEEEASTVTAFYPDHQRWYEVHAYPAPEGAAVYFRNVTERVQGELALKESEERYRRAAAAAAQAAGFNAKFRVFFEQGTSFAGVLTLDGTLLEANRLSLEACGFTRDEVIGRKFWECGWWNRSTELMATVRRAVEQAAGGHQFRSESPYFVAGGGERFVDLSLAPITDDRGYVLFVAASGRDVTEQKRAAGDLQLQTDRLRLLWEAAAVLLTTDEPDAMIRAVFARIAPRFGLDAYFNFMVNDARDALRLESCQGVPDGVVPSIQRLEFGQAVCGTVAVNHRPMTAVHIQESADPKVQLVKSFGIRAYACHPLLVGDRLLGTLSFASRTREEFDADEVDFMRTICHYVTVAYERIRLVRELRDADRKKDDFIAMLAHELRNPLAPIRNGLEVLRMAGDKPAAFARARGMMERQLAHMVRLIDDLLDVSRISRNKMELRRSRVALADVISSALETVAPQLQAAGHVLNVALPGSPVYLDADLTRLAQVFGNLVSNSIKYTAPGGRIWLSAQVRGDRVSVTVRDTGIGIPQESLEHIFDMFSQVDRPFEKSSGGLGIGLALVKGLVGMHGGTVSATSEGQDRGSTFTVTLPLAPVTTEKDGTKAGGPGTAARSACKFLVVDDNADGAESMAEMLRLLGNEVVTAGDGLEAVERANAFRPEVILMDIGLPRMNGLEAAKRIRGEPWGRGVTIVACTGWGQDHDRERSRAAGCDGHLVKPVNFQDLEKLLGELLRNRNGRA